MVRFMGVLNIHNVEEVEVVKGSEYEFIVVVIANPDVFVIYLSNVYNNDRCYNYSK